MQTDETTGATFADKWNQFTITAGAASKNERAQFTVTVQNQMRLAQFNISASQLRVFSRFQLACLNAAVCLPVLPRIKGQRAAETWKQIITNLEGPA